MSELASACRAQSAPEQAPEALAKWRYNPKIENGQPVERRVVETRIVFQLEE